MIFQIRSQEYDDANDIADILKIKDFGSDSNDTIEENISVRKNYYHIIAVNFFSIGSNLLKYHSSEFDEIV